MVSCLFWTPDGSLGEGVLPQTRDLARRVASWDFVKKVAWLGRPPSWWQADVIPAEWSDRRGWLQALLQASGNEEHLMLIPADAPLLREDLSRQIWQTHRQHKADYTFADCYPLGLAPEAVSTFALQGIAALEQAEELPDRQGLFSCLLHHVNHFDVETLLSPIDLRTWRITFFDDCPRNRLLISRFLERAQWSLDRFLSEVARDRVSQRTLPAYWKMQWTNAVAQVPAYSDPRFYSTTRVDLPLEDLRRMLERVGRWMGGGVLLPGFWGEVALYPHAVAALRSALELGFELVVETSGLGWTSEVLNELGRLKGKITWIVEADAWEPQLYRQLRGEGFEVMRQTAQTLRDMFSGRVYLQTTRCDLTEDHVENFYIQVKEEGYKPLVVGYNDMAGRLPNRRTVDLSPWKRHPCWHLQRGLHSLADGRVVSCHQYPQGEVYWGNLLEEDPAAVWERGTGWMLAHQEERYPEECRSCHEYFQFVF